MRIGYADPPYPGQAHLYKDHPDFAGEVDHYALLQDLDAEYDGWIYHTSSTALFGICRMIETASRRGRFQSEFRIMAWVKPFAAFKRNVSIAYAWEPILVKSARKPTVRKDMDLVYRDWLAESITLKRGLTGAKPEKVCHWLFECVGAEPDDELDDLFPGTGAVTSAWETWKELRAEVAA